DVVGVELGGALKNVVALAAGVADGMHVGDNAKAALITRGLAEMSRLGQALGADARTFAGLAGLGDLVATCASPFSRTGGWVSSWQAVRAWIRPSARSGSWRKGCQRLARLWSWPIRPGWRCQSSGKCTRCCSKGRTRGKRCWI